MYLSARNSNLFHNQPEIRLMIKLILAIAMALLLSLSAQAKGSSHVGSNDVGAPQSADLIFTINDSSIKYRADGYIMVCLNREKKRATTCEKVEGRKDDAITLDEFWKWYFSSAPTIRVVAMNYSAYHGVHIFWLKR